MKRRLCSIAAIIMLLALLAGGTLSYVGTETRVTNVITTGGVDIKIYEKTDTGDDFPKEGVTVLAGDVISKIVTVENSGTTDAYLRIKLTKRVNDESLSAEDCLSMDINTDCWTYADGYYYYNTALAAGEVTEPLFTKVYVDGMQVDNSYLGKVLSLDVTAYAVQSGHNGDSVWDAAGWPGI